MATLNSKYPKIKATATKYLAVNVVPLKNAAQKCITSADAYKTAFDLADGTIQTAETALSNAKDTAKQALDAEIAAAKAKYKAATDTANANYDTATGGVGKNLSALASQMTSDYSEFLSIYKDEATVSVGVDVNFQAA